MSSTVKRQLAGLTLAILTTGILSACGYKGALYHPAPADQELTTPPSNLPVSESPR